MFACGLVGAFVHRAMQPPLAQASQTATMQNESGAGELPDLPAATGSASINEGDVSIADQDAQCAHLLTQAAHGEAITWLTQHAANHGVAEWEKAEAIDLFKEFYAAGAKQIDVIDVDTAGDIEIASQFIVTLPTDAADRARVFALEAQFQAEYDEDPTPDRGQRYLQLTTD
jgi:hypothetical protein